MLPFLYLFFPIKLFPDLLSTLLCLFSKTTQKNRRFYYFFFQPLQEKPSSSIPPDHNQAYVSAISRMGVLLMYSLPGLRMPTAGDPTLILPPGCTIKTNFPDKRSHFDAIYCIFSFCTVLSDCCSDDNASCVL